MRYLCGLLLSCVSLLTWAEPAPLRVAAASDLTSCLPLLNTGFVQQHGGRVEVSYGSSGTFYAQLSRGAPYDVFLSADRGYAEALSRTSRGLADSLTPYARGRLALWSMAPGLDLSAGLAVLQRPEVQRIALANPDHAPYGRLAREVLQGAGVWGPLQPKLVFGEGAAQALQFVQTGNAQVGLLAYPLVKSQLALKRGQGWLLPAALHAPMEQAGLALRGPGEAVARVYLRYLRSPAAARQLQDCGFDPVP